MSNDISIPCNKPIYTLKRLEINDVNQIFLLLNFNFDINLLAHSSPSVA